MVRSIPARVAVSFAIAVVVAACGSGGGSPSRSVSSGASSGSGTVSAPASPTAASTSAVAGCDSAPWQSAPVTVTHNVGVPPVPVISGVHVAQHPECGYDRLVLDIRGPIPGYTVRYVDEVIADPSGRTVTMPGVRYLLVIVRPAQAHTDAGAATIPGGVHTPTYPALASWTLAGDFEGVVRIALGVGGHLSVRTGELPGRIYIDIKE